MTYFGIMQWNVGFPSLGVLLQKLENPALRACLKVPSNEVSFIFHIVDNNIYLHLSFSPSFGIVFPLLNPVPLG